MTIRNIATAAALGFAVSAAAPMAFAEPDKDTQYAPTTPGVGVVEDIGNNQATDTELFDTGERPRANQVYDVESGMYVDRAGAEDKTRAVEQAIEPEINHGNDVK